MSFDAVSRFGEIVKSTARPVRTVEDRFSGFVITEGEVIAADFSDSSARDFFRGRERRRFL